MSNPNRVRQQTIERRSRWCCTLTGLIIIALYVATWFIHIKWTGHVQEWFLYCGHSWVCVYPRSVVLQPGFEVAAVKSPRLSQPFAPGSVANATTTNLAMFVGLALGLIATPWVRLYVVRRLVPPGHCKACRYDLSAIPGDVCPECGGTGTRVLPSATIS